MLYCLHRSLVKPFEPSSRAAALVGPKVRKPAASMIVDDAGDQRIVRADHHEVDRELLAERHHRRVVGDVDRTHSASCAMPALPGAHQSLVVSGEAAIFQASACSRPPEPRRRMFMAGM